MDEEPGSAKILKTEPKDKDYDEKEEQEDKESAASAVLDTEYHNDNESELDLISRVASTVKTSTGGPGFKLKIRQEQVLELPKVVCPECGKGFKSGQALGGHMKKHYKVAITSTTTTPAAAASASTSASHGDSARLMDKDDEGCKRMIEAALILCSVKRGLDVDEDNISDEVINRMKMKLVDDKPKPKDYKCNICNASFTSYHGLGGHTRHCAARFKKSQ